jgi:CheY-like chemotaxis protein
VQQEQVIQQAIPVLIVDDSKTSRVMLSRMLEKRHIPAAAVESAEDALEYLRRHQPPIIFMDHMMPGMDGFAAVKAIKADPEKSSIPIVMHTTRRGDIYLGQARALGAIDLLSKPASDEALLAVLERVEKYQAEMSQMTGSVADSIEGSVAKPVTEQGVELATSELTDNDAGLGLSAGLGADAVASPFYGTARQWLFVLVWLLPIVWLLALYLETDARLKVRFSQQEALIKTVEWSLNLNEGYDYGEAPLGGTRLELLKGLLGKLRNGGFKGVIRMEGHLGEFCLSSVTLADGSEIDILPNPGLPLSACATIGSSAAVAAKQSVQQSEAFSRYITEQHLLSPGAAIKLELLAYGVSSPEYTYPVELSGVTTGDWNAVALNNNRVRISLLVD